MSRRDEVWITGIGAHTAAGVGAGALRVALYQGASLGGSVESLGGLWVARAPDPPCDRVARRLDRCGQFFLLAAREAWRQAGLDVAGLDPDRVAVIDGSSLGPMGDLLAIERARVAEGFPERIPPTHLIRMMFGAGGAQFAQEVGARGAVFALSAGSTSGAMAIADGWSKIRAGMADVVVTGGADAPLDPEVIAVFRTAGILAPPDACCPCRPFDVARRGTMLGEGAGVVVLERADHARRRGASPMAILPGAGISGEEGSMTAPDIAGEGTVRALRAALPGNAADRIGWIKAHGTATLQNDAAECRALRGLREDLPLSSLKPLFGHCLGASGAVELVAGVLALDAGLIPATLGTSDVDPLVGRRRVVLEPERLRHPGGVMLSQSLGGRCVALAVARAA